MTDTIGDSDLETIVPAPGTVVIDEVLCNVNRLKTREFLSLLRVMTSAFGESLKSIKLSVDDDEALQQELLGLLVVALPNAVDEFVEFLKIIVQPTNAKHTGKVRQALDNPEIEVMLGIAEVVITQEISDLRVLAGKAQAMWTKVQGVYQAGK
jgi:hypothetical protein